jgi:hypothetical protein
MVPARLGSSANPSARSRPIGGLVASIVFFAKNPPTQRPAVRLTRVVGAISDS